MMEGGTFGLDYEEAALNLALPRGWQEKEEVEKVLHHFRYEVTANAIKTQGVSFILFLSKEPLSHINPSFFVIFFDRRHVWDV
jgi:hypothetical protein